MRKISIILLIHMATNKMLARQKNVLPYCFMPINIESKSHLSMLEYFFITRLYLLLF